MKILFIGQALSERSQRALPFFGNEREGDAFNIDEATLRFKRLTAMILDCDAVILCGLGVAIASGILDEGRFDKTLMEKPVIAIPHPSRVNRFWNNRKIIGEYPTIFSHS